jgi:hypothetical protein
VLDHLRGQSGLAFDPALLGAALGVLSDLVEPEADTPIVVNIPR